jgi:hypothetical protein
MFVVAANPRSLSPRQDRKNCCPPRVVNRNGAVAADDAAPARPPPSIVERDGGVPNDDFEARRRSL